MRIDSATLRLFKDETASVQIGTEAECSIYNAYKLHSSGDFTGTEASCTDIYMTRCAVNNSLDTLYVGFPSPVGSSVRVGNLNAECHAFVANLAFCHLLHLLAAYNLFK